MKRSELGTAYQRTVPKSADFTASIDDDLYNVTAATTPVAATLPDPAGNFEERIQIVNLAASRNIVVVGASAGSIIGNTILMPGDSAVFVSDGIGNWLNFQPAKQVGVLQTTIAAAAVLDLADTPVELAPSPGAGRVIQFLGALLILDYNSAAYTESADNLTIDYTNEAGVSASEVIEMTGFIDATADKMITAVPVKDVIPVAAAALVLVNPNDDFGAGNSPLRVRVMYAIHATGL